jgi:hypothetical protein
MRQYPNIYSQRDPQWAGNELGTAQGSTIGAYGCLLSCDAMKACYYGHQIAPNALNDIYTQKNLYQSQDLIANGDLPAVFSDIQLTDSKDYSSVPADLNYLKTLATDPTITVTIELDFDHDPNDGIQTHFVELHEFDGTTLTIYDPWYGTDDNFTLHYGTNIGQTIQSIAVYKGTPVAAPVSVDSATFTKLVANSTANDAVCDELGLPHDAGKDAEVAAIIKIKADKAADDQTIVNLNKQIPDLEGQISTLTNQVTDLTQKSQDTNGLLYKDLFNQAESSLTTTKQALADEIELYNRTVAQYQNTSALSLSFWEFVKLKLSKFFAK